MAGGGFTGRVFQQLEPGAVLPGRGPLGTFVPRGIPSALLFVAGGTGFAPVKALVEHFLHLGTRRRMTLYWGARSVGELYLRELARALGARVAGFCFVPVVSDPQCARRTQRHGA